MNFKMEAIHFLTNSNFCRLCGEENKNGIDLFTEDENSEALYTLINRYLPVKVQDGDFFPKKICPGCHIQLESTKLFMDLIIEGQGKLRSLLKAQQELLNREEKERQKLEQVLHNHNPNASVETYTIEADENGEKYIIQIYSDGPLFSPEHQLTLKAEGLDKPKRKRGRPPKIVSTEELSHEPSKHEELVPTPFPAEPSTDEESSSRRKRKIRPPARYEGVVQGKELVKILKKEGVIDEDTDALEDDYPGKNEKGFCPPQKSDIPKTVIGTVVEADGEAQVEQLVFMKSRPRISRVRKIGSPKQKFICNICKKEFQHHGRCEMHKRSHRLKFGCQGKYCTFQGESREAVAEHQKETGHEGTSTFEQINELNGTVVLAEVSEEINGPIIVPESQQERKSLECEKCNKTFNSKQSYEVHLKAIHNGEKPFMCKMCDRSFAYACSLKNHMSAHLMKSSASASDGYTCDVCEKKFQHPSSLVYHKDTEHGNRRFICNKCHKSFKHRQLLLRHQLVHSEDRPFKCGECNRQFKSKTNLANHENIHKGIKKFVCPTCGNSFLHKTSLWVHLKWHDGKKPYVCEVCNKAFSQKGNLIEHQRIHTGEKPFSCNLCGRNFTTSSQCKLHMKRHTGEKPHTCKYCQKQFLHKETYESHLRRHLGERPFRCKFCGKAFPEQWACTRHERIHLGIKKYKCDVCAKSFSDSANFSKHKKIHLKNGIKSQNLVKTPGAVVNNHVNKLDTPSGVNIEILPSTEEAVTKPEVLNQPPDLQIHNLLDQEGNAISITTADGQPIPIVSSGNEKFQGLLPDGTLVSFDIVPEEQGKEQQEGTTQLTAPSDVNLLKTEIQFLEEDSISSSSANLVQEKPAFLSEDGKVCFITAFDDNSFL